MRTLHRLPVVCLSAALLAAAAPPAAGAAARWTHAASFAAGADDRREPVPRVAVAADGTSAVAFFSRSGALMLATARAGRRFGAPRVIERRGVRGYSIAAARGGAFLLAWEDSDGLRAAVRTKAGRRIVRRRYRGGPRSQINGVQVAADPRGGYALARLVFPHGPRKDRRYGVRALSVDPAGRLLGAVQDLGAGQFGVDARPTQALAVGGDGRAVLTFTRESPSGAAFDAPAPVVVSVRPHGGAFGAPVALAGAAAADPRVAVDAAGRAVIAATQIVSARRRRRLRPPDPRRRARRRLARGADRTRPDASAARVRAERGADEGRRRRARLPAEDRAGGVLHRGAGARGRVRRRRRARPRCRR